MLSIISDPYLTHGTCCEVWNGDAIIPIKRLAYFSQSIDGMLHFYDDPTDVRLLTVFDHYRPIGTEWEFAPPGAVCSTVDADGGIRFWETNNLCRVGGEWIDRDYGNPDCQNSSDFICPDKSRYAGEYWKISLRMRPAWAGGEKL